MGRRSRKGGQQSKVSAFMPNISAAREMHRQQKEEEGFKKAEEMGITVKPYAQAKYENDQRAAAAELRAEQAKRYDEQQKIATQPVSSQSPPSPALASVRDSASVFGSFFGGRKSRKLGTKFSRCVKSVRKTVKVRKGSTKESAAIAICTTSVLHPRGRTIKRYSKKRLVTQRRR